MTFTERFTELQAQYPKMKMVKIADSKFFKIVFWFAKNIFRMKEDYAKDFSIILGWTLYTCGDWDTLPDIEKLVLIEHESVHFGQKTNWLFGPKFAWLNYYLFTFAVIALLPILLTMRSHFEREAYSLGQ